MEPDLSQREELIACLAEYVSPGKRERVAEVLSRRTRRIALVLENVYHPHNASACLRSCECLGVQDVHIIESARPWRPNSEVALGASRWLTVQRHESTAACLDALVERGCRLVAARPGREGGGLGSLPLDRPLALLFGTEKEGLGEEALARADLSLSLPLHGFTRSYNVSVAAALALHGLVERLRRSGIDWGLSAEEKRELTLAFYRRIVRRSDLIEEEFRRRRGTG